MSVFFVESERGGKLLSCDNYLYRICNKAENRSYWKCATSQACQARVVFKDDVVKQVKIHSHEAKPHEIKNKLFTANVRARVRQDPKAPIKKIYEEEVAAATAEGVSNFPTLKNIEKMLYRARAWKNRKEKPDDGEPPSPKVVNIYKTTTTVASTPNSYSMVQVPSTSHVQINVGMDVSPTNKESESMLSKGLETPLRTDVPQNLPSSAVRPYRSPISFTSLVDDSSSAEVPTPLFAAEAIKQEPREEESPIAIGNYWGHPGHHDVAVETDGTGPAHQQDDEIDAFLKNIGLQMRKLPLECNLELMAEFQNIISRKRLEYIKAVKCPREMAILP